MTEWQPIDTAPDDNRDVLVRMPDGFISIWRADGEWWREQANNPDQMAHIPTHWMPLPAFP